jgi:putative transposase
VIATIKEYRRVAKNIADFQWRRFYEDARPFGKNLSIKHIPSALSERYKQTCQWQVVGVLDSFIANRKNDFVTTVIHSSLPEETKIALLTINKYNLWYRKRLRDIDTDTLKLARKIFNHILSRHRKPSFKNISMHLDNKVALISRKIDSKAVSFDYWVRLSTMDKGSPVYLPVITNQYFEDIEGELKNFCQVGLTDNGELTVSLIKDVPDKGDTYKPVTDRISIDTGLKALFATNAGDLFGRRFYETLSKLDALITTLAANRQRQGLRIRSSRYDKLVNRLRAYLKNEINRCLNRLVAMYMPAEIVVERLDFRHPQLSRRMNRLVSRFGKSVIKAKLTSLSEEYGIVITESNAAYSSQECSVCGYVDRKNRKDQAVFECRFCGTGLHADVNAARNHLARSSCGVIDIYRGKKAVLHTLVSRFLSVLPDMEQKFGMPNSKAKDLLSGNPYFKEALAQSEGFL